MKYKNSSVAFKAGALLTLFALVLSGCGGSGLLLDKDALARIPTQPDDSHRIVYFNKTFTYTPAGGLLEKTHQVVRVGRNAGSFPAQIEVIADSGRKLIALEGRATHRSGSTETFSMIDFVTYNLSSRERISEKFSKRAMIREKVTPGDLIETVSLHEQILPVLGIDFSLDELDYAADDVNCSIETGPADSLLLKLVNSTIAPVVHDSGTGWRVSFHWDAVRTTFRRRHQMEKLNTSPQILATRSPRSWRSFGDWYLTLAGPKLQAGRVLTDTALSITAGKTTPKAKMDAIFEYCQRSIRYEQVYFGLGGIVPTGVDAVFARKYGDCKDYASLMYAMATAVGVKSHIALCHRGRGVEFFDDIPLNQFNHAILHFEDGGRDYWYDGTNRVGLPGITAFDLANARALVLDAGNSRLMTIEESPSNSLTVKGTLVPHDVSSLSGRLTVTFSHQYAIEFFWLASGTNKEEMGDYVRHALRSVLNENIVVDTLAWSTEGDTFRIDASCELPNSITVLQDQAYVSVARILPNLLPLEMEDARQGKIFYFPWHNMVVVDLLCNRSGSAAASPRPLLPVRLELRYQLPAGPWSDAGRERVLAELESVAGRYRQLHKLPGISAP